MAGKVQINDGSLFLNEQAEAQTDITAYGQLWVKDSTPNELWFTDDAGNDVQLGTGGGFSSKCSVFQSSAQTIPTHTATKIQFDTINYDTDGEFDNTTNYRFTATNAGYYHVDSQVRVQVMNDTDRVEIAIYVNGSPIAVHSDFMSGTAASFPFVSKDVYLEASDYIEAYVTQYYGSDRTTTASSQYTFMTIHRFA